MSKKFSILIVLSILSIGYVDAEVPHKSNTLKPDDSLEVDSNPATLVCDSNMVFKTLPTIKQQTLKLDDKVSIELNQFLSTQSSHYGAKIATNVICQQLEGSRYTGSKKEWAQFIQHGANGLQRSGGKELRFDIVGEREKFFHQNIENREYTFYGRFNGIMQVIRNVAILDKKNNTIYTISVSAAEKGDKAVVEELKRILSTFTLKRVADH